MSIWLFPFLLIYQWLTILICARVCSLLVFHRALRCCLLLLSVPALVPQLCVFAASVLRSTSSMDFLISLYDPFPHLFLALLHFSHPPVNLCLLSFFTLFACAYSVLLSFLVHLSPDKALRAKGCLSFVLFCLFFMLSLMLCQYGFCLFYWFINNS